MDLFDEDGSLSLLVKGLHTYDPDLAIEGLVIVPDESPWLDVQLRATSTGGTWGCEGPLLELSNIPYIADWFRALADGRDTHRELYFEEPNLAFAVIGKVPSGIRLRVALDSECRPPWAPGFVGDLPDPSFEITVTGPMLRAAANDLDDQIRNWASSRTAEIPEPSDLDSGYPHRWRGGRAVDGGALEKR